MLTHQGAIYRLGAATRKPSGAASANAGSGSEHATARLRAAGMAARKRAANAAGPLSQVRYRSNPIVRSLP